MGTIKINEPSEIYDDPEYCGNDTEDCGYYYITTGRYDGNYHMCGRFPQELEYKNGVLKCAACRKAWAKAKHPGFKNQITELIQTGNG
jgi:hypothetical protein